MKYEVKIQVTYERTVTVHAANEIIAADKAQKIGQSWNKPVSVKALGVREAIYTPTDPV